MPTVQATLEYLQKLPLYEEEKPYWCFLPPRDGFDPDTQRVDNLEFEEQSNIAVQDLRELGEAPRIDDYGFEVLKHESKFVRFDETDAADQVEQYRSETEELLKERLGAEYVICYDHRLRKNIPYCRKQYDLNDPLLREGPAQGVHNDVTYDSGPQIINRYLSEDSKKQYLQQGYRFRIINTWRTLIPVLEDRPLALCDSRSVDPEDLVPADRIIPDKVGEVYYLTHNPKHKWYWLDKQSASEPFAFVMYDTKAGSHARFCPHVSFINPLAPKDAPPRESMETRSIVITRE